MSIQTRIAQIQKRMDEAAKRSERKPGSVRLVAVSKTVPPDRIRHGIQNGITILGENYIQEAREKIRQLADFSVSWHFIGHLQTNKAKYAVELFDLIHSVDSFKLAKELDKRAGKIGKIQDILIQINIAEEATKSGIETTDALGLIQDIKQLTNVRINGLMTMPPFFDNPQKARPFFAALRRLRSQLLASGIDKACLKELSMGMSGDFEAAIEEGATIVRVGTAIFGQRQ